MINYRGCTLKNMRVEDVDKVAELLMKDYAKVMFSNELMKYHKFEEIKSFLIDRLNQSNNNLYFIGYSRNNNMMGYASVMNVNWVQGNAEFSIVLNDKYRNTGSGQILGKMVLDMCFNELNLIKVSILIKEENINLLSKINNKLKLQKVENISKDNVVETYYFDEIYRCN
ncbi:GNAT family N-acetyltransferase [Abyssisolibacter fermentans]|uniref:GNAT family N-acetyltransferase n=1 Tax=Abyssisolibacter fermentans TaxID=1766203 RepID=UPI0008366493|nr:GNAT family N-acetyltransferase [Abyssisolibacter fermentans]